MRPPIFSLLQTTAVTIATILGTGILGLPVSLHSSGLRPFLITFTLNLFAQVGIVIATVELLQRTYEYPADSNSDSLSFHPLQHPDHQRDQDRIPSPPSLHSLGHRFIPSPIPRFFFNLLVLAHFLFILSAYALAGPQTISSLFPSMNSMPKWILATIFVLLAATAVIFFSKALIAPLTIGTAVKATLLTTLVAVILVRGLTIHQTITDNWSPHVLVDPFLMGNFALNGVVNLMPVTFQTCLDSTKIANSDSALLFDVAFVRAYRWATVVGVITCYLLNVAWCFAVLLCVPQGEALTRDVKPVNLVANVGYRLLQPLVDRVSTNATLASASQLGQISTIPLIQVLKARGDRIDGVISFLVSIFIGLSIVISFLVMSIGLKHYIDGGAVRQARISHVNYDVNRTGKYVAAFGAVLSIAISNPAGLLKIMEGFTTLSLNLEAGVFILYMLHVGRRMTKSIPDPLSSAQYNLLMGFAGSYTAATVLVDVIFYIPRSFT